MFRSVRNTFRYLRLDPCRKARRILLLFAAITCALFVTSAAMYVTAVWVRTSILHTLDHLPGPIADLPRPVVRFYAHEQAGDTIIHDRDAGPVAAAKDSVLRFGFENRRSTRTYEGEDAKFWSDADIRAEIETVNPYRGMILGRKPPQVRVTIRDIPSQLLHREVSIGVSRYTDGYVAIMNSLDDYGWSETQIRDDILLYPITSDEAQLIVDAFPRSIEWVKDMRRRALYVMIGAAFFFLTTMVEWRLARKAARRWYG